MPGGTIAGNRWRWLAGAVLGPAVLALLVSAAVAVAQSMSVEGGLSGLERDAFGWLLLHRKSRPTDPRIAFVAVDSKLYEQTEALNLSPSTPPGTRSLESYAAKDCACQPVPRICYALAVERLQRWGARAVVLDIMFSHKGYSPTDVAEDERLGKDLRHAGAVVAGVMQALALDRSRDPTRTSDVLIDRPISALTDPPPDAKGDAAFETVQVGSPKIDPRDQEYAFELEQTARTGNGEMQTYFSMPYLAYCSATKRQPDDFHLWKGRWVDGTEPRLLGDLFTGGSAAAAPKAAGGGAAPAGGVDLITTGNTVVDQALYQKRLLINYTWGANADQGRFHPARLSWLLTCPEAEGKQRFQGRIVLIGNPATDLHRTVVGALPGTEVLANAVQTLLQDRPIVPAPRWTLLLALFLPAFAAAVLVRQAPAYLALLAVIGGLGGILLLSLRLVEMDIWLMPASPAVSLALTAGLAFFTESRVGQGMVARLIPSRISRTFERAGGFQVEEGTVMFSDIRGYSTFSEYLDPAEMMGRLNAYFATVHEVLDRYDGHFIKSPGDCVVAWFSDEKRSAHHADRAVRAAIELVMNAVRFRKQWPAEEGKPFDIGVGINTGPMAVGILDARRHIEPTVIGDTVNLASRIESLTKDYGAAIIVSEDTLAPVRENFIYESLGETTVKGRSQPVRIYRIIGISERGAETQKADVWWRGRKQRVRRDALFFRVTEMDEALDADGHTGVGGANGRAEKSNGAAGLPGPMAEEEPEKASSGREA